MLKLLVTAMVAAIMPAGTAQAQTFFAEGGGWKVFKQDGNCIGFFDSPPYAITVYYPRQRDMLTVVTHAIGVPGPDMMAAGGFKVMMGDTEWGPMIVTPRSANSQGVTGVQIMRRDPRALDDFGKASSIVFRTRDYMTATVYLSGTYDAATILRRCAG